MNLLHFSKPSVFGLVIFAFLFFLQQGCSENMYSKGPCTSARLYEDNSRNDTNIVLFNSRAAFDTTANMLRCLVLDSVNNKPVAGVKINLFKDSVKISAVTDNEGNFVIFKNGFTGSWQMMVEDSSGGYKCLLVNQIEIGGRLDITVRLTRSFLACKVN